MPRTEDWFADKPPARRGGSAKGGRGNVKISRRQLPLTPAGAATVHSTQGETRDAVIVAGAVPSAPGACRSFMRVASLGWPVACIACTCTREHTRLACDDLIVTAGVEMLPSDRPAAPVW